MLPRTDPDEIPSLSNHPAFSLEGEEAIHTISTHAEARLGILTPVAPLTPRPSENPREALPLEIKVFVIAKATVSSAFGGAGPSDSSAARVDETKNEDMLDFQVLFESTPGPYLILKPNSDFTIVAVNDAYLKATMTQRELILGRGLFEVFPDNPSDPKADGVRNLRYSLQQVIEKGIADTMPIQKYDIRRPAAEGSEFEERYWSPINTPVLGRTGAVNFIIHRVEDVTDFIHLKQQEIEQQKRAQALQVRTEQMEAELYNHSRDIQKKEEALKISHKRYSTLASMLPVGVFHTDLEGRCLYVNPHWQRMTGIKREEAIEQKWFTLSQPADQSAVLNAWEHCQATGSCQVEFRFFGAHRKEYWVLAQLTAEWVDNEVKGYVGSITDITELKELEETRIAVLRQAEEYQRKLAEAAENYRQNQEQFIDTMCHELRNPLNGIYGNVGLLQSSSYAMEKIIRGASPLELTETLRDTILHQLENDRASLEAIDKCARYQKVITDDVLNLSKLEAGKVELNLIDFDLRKLVRDTVGMLETQAHQKQIRLHLNLPSSHIRVIGDPNRLMQVLLNLLSNALKFTLETGTVTVSFSILEETRTHTIFRFTVKDTGIGMSEEEQNKLFNRFAQASSKISTEHGGSGLGLMISKNLIELMEGKIEVESKKWKGTQFSFTIKLAPAPRLQEEEKSTLAVPVSSKKLNLSRRRGLNILIAEDSLINQKILARQLQQAGHICHVANNGQEALEMHGKIPIDLIFMDIEMPIKNGLEATQAIRQKEQASSLCTRIPIIGLSGNARSEHREEALGVGMDAYLTKPYDKEKLLEMIAHSAPSLSPRAAVDRMSTPATLFSSITPRQSQHREAGSSFFGVCAEAKEEQETAVISARVKKKEKSKDVTSFWNKKKLGLSVLTIGSLAMGAALVVKNDRKQYV
ncbi:MAG: multisensor hybrid histidine kinase [Gammaproteobacteria bacterium]|jgi:PAS domain S-box-containing protein|nr:multisensor hybrid histidine kinase [Gammaproteobacteria bacterium]